MHNVPFDKNSIILAPMAGVTDSGFRKVCMKHGADCTFSEMVSSKGIYYNDEKSKALFRHTDDEMPIVFQIFGSDSDCMKRAAEYICKNHSPAGIDINMGCPAPKIFQNGDGCALMNDPDKAYKIIASVKSVSSFPVSVKFRSGVDRFHINAVEFAKMCESAGADYITVHARTREQFYSGCADINIIRAVVDAVNIPVVANGDITDGESASGMLALTGAHSIMIGRAAMGDPVIFNRIKCHFGAGTEDETTAIDAGIEHLNYMLEDKPEFQAVREFRKHMLHYLKNIKNASMLKNQCCKANTKQDCLNIFEIAKNNSR